MSKPTDLQLAIVVAVYFVLWSFIMFNFGWQACSRHRRKVEKKYAIKGATDEQ